MPDLPLVSAVIPAYNVSRYIRQSVDSALAQTYERMEVVVVNDGSTDDTGEILRSYGDQIRCVTQANQGLSAARNSGIRASRGELIAFLDADDLWLAGKTAAQVELMRRSPDRVGLVSSPCYMIDAQGEITGERSSDELPQGSTPAELVLYENTMGLGSAAMVSRECLDRVGLFDERLLNGSEDWDFYLRIAAASYRFAYTDEPLVKIRALTDSMSSAGNVDRMLKNDLMVLDKVFLDPKLSRRMLLRGRAYSFRYLTACWALVDLGEDRLADLRRALLYSFIYYPPSFLDRAHVAMILHSVFGRKGVVKIKQLIGYRGGE